MNDNIPSDPFCYGETIRNAQGVALTVSYMGLEFSVQTPKGFAEIMVVFMGAEHQNSCILGERSVAWANAVGWAGGIGTWAETLMTGFANEYWQSVGEDAQVNDPNYGAPRCWN